MPPAPTVRNPGKIYKSQEGIWWSGSVTFVDHRFPIAWVDLMMLNGLSGSDSIIIDRRRIVGILVVGGFKQQTHKILNHTLIYL